MNDALTHLARALVDRHTFGAIMLLAIAAFGWRSRSSFRSILGDDSSFWRLTARVFVASFVATAVWIALFDDWIQLFSEPYRLTRDLSVDRVVADPIPTELRAITVTLLAITVVSTAAIVARHIGGYGLQIGALLLGVTFWLVLFIFEQRLDILVHDGAADPITSTSSFVGLAMFWVLRTGLGVAMAFLSLGIAVLVVAPFVTLLLDLFRVRKPRVALAASDEFFATLHKQAQNYVPDDTPQARKRRSLRGPS